MSEMTITGSLKPVQRDELTGRIEADTRFKRYQPEPGSQYHAALHGLHSWQMKIDYAQSHLALLQRDRRTIEPLTVADMTTRNYGHIAEARAKLAIIDECIKQAQTALNEARTSANAHNHNMSVYDHHLAPVWGQLENLESAINRAKTLEADGLPGATVATQSAIDVARYDQLLRKQIELKKRYLQPS